MKISKLLCIASAICLTASAADDKPKGGAPARQMPVPTVGVTTAMTLEDFETRHYTGAVTSQSTVNIVSRVSGELVEICFKEGDFVKKDQVLYRLDDVQYQASVKGCEALLAKCKAEFAYAESNFNRTNKLFEKGVSTLDDMENSRASFEAARGALFNAEASLITAKDNLAHTVIKAPQDGFVGTSSCHVGDYLTLSSGTLLTIVRTQPIRVRFAIGTADFLSIFGNVEGLKKNAQISLTLADGTAYPEEGVVELMNNQANARTDTILVYAEFPNASSKLVVGSTVTVKVTLKSGNRRVAIPPSAVVHNSQGAFVYVLDGENKAQIRPVVLGNARGDAQLIISGVKEGDRVVYKGTHKIVMPNMAVVPADK